MPKTAPKTDRDQDVAEAVEEVKRACQIAKQLFGATVNTFAEYELHAYLQGSDDEDDLLADLQASVASCKDIHKTDAPTPEQVFGFFKNVFVE